MAIIGKFPFQFMQDLLQKEHDLGDDTLKVALMNTTFSFDPETHATWADCSSDEITAGNGYTAGGEILANVSIDIDAVEEQVLLSADNVTWTATGGAIPDTGGAVIYNSSHSENGVVMSIDFGADYSITEDKVFQINFTDGFGALENE